MPNATEQTAAATAGPRIAPLELGFPEAIAVRLAQPSPAEVRRVRESADLSRPEAAGLVSTAAEEPRRVFEAYESSSKANGRKIPLPVWELFLLMTNQHPTLQLVKRQTPYIR